MTVVPHWCPIGTPLVLDRGQLLLAAIEVNAHPSRALA